MANRRSAGATPAVRELTRLGIAFTTHAYQHDAAAESYGREAAELLGVDPARVFKTLLASVGDGHVVAMVPVLESLDLKALARTARGRKATMTPPSDAERLTGYVVGGISPIGQRRRLPTVLDRSAEAYETVLVSGGRRGFDLELSPAALVSATGATTAPISR